MVEQLLFEETVRQSVKKVKGEAYGDRRMGVIPSVDLVSSF